jgi:6-phosphogluconolactonase
MLRVEVMSDPNAVGDRAAELVADAVRRVTVGGGRFAWGISGGETPGPMFRRLAASDLPWDRVDTWQVDERIAPLGDPERNRSHQERALPPAAAAGIRWMPVEDRDLDAAAARYAGTLPERFDLLHLGLGADGHTASLVPGDPVLDVRDRSVGVTRPSGGRRRMTLTYPGLARAGRAIWVVTGETKREALRRLIEGDGTIPAARVAIADRLVVADRAATGGSRREVP